MLSNLFKVGWEWKNADICHLLTSLVSLEQRNLEKPKRLMKIVNIVTNNIVWYKISVSSKTTGGISIKFSGKMWLIVILKVMKTRALSLSSFKRVTA